jgi:hypothetical protein
MAKEKKSTGKSTPKKTAAKKSRAGSTAASPNSVAEKITATEPVSEPSFKSAPVRVAKPSAAEIHNEIRLRAYELFRERGGQHGSHEADWQRAEAEVRSKYK